MNYAIELIIQRSDWPALTEMFARQGYQPPQLMWAPSEADLTAESLRHALGYWVSLRQESKAPSHRQFEPEALHPHLGWISLLEPTDDGSDFRYRIYGTKLADLAGFDLNGKFVSEMPTPELMKAFLIGGHRAVVNNQRPLLSVHVPPPTSNTAFWSRLLLPLLDDEGKVCRILAINCPGPLRPPSIDHYARFYRTLVDV